MTLLGMQVAVIGGGIGGLTAALCLAQRGAQVQVFEQAPAITEVGAGLQMSPNGFCVLRALGLGDAISQAAVRAQAVELRDYRAGRLVTRLNVGQLGKGQPYFFLHRADLIDVLYKFALESGVKVVTGAKVQDVDDGTGQLLFADGTSETADLIIGADGLHSVVRPNLNGTLAPFFTGQTAWRATVPMTSDVPDVATVHMGPKRHVVSYPLRGGKLMNLVAVQEKPEWQAEGWSHQDDPDNLREAFADFGGEISKILKNVTETGVWGLFRHPVAPRWHGASVALLGDAAHPTLPFMAQGAVMAIEDAWVLADALSVTDDKEAGLALYQSRRMERVTKIVEAANGNAWKYHLSNPLIRTAAHTAMRLAGTIVPGKMMGQFDWIYRHDVTAV